MNNLIKTRSHFVKFTVVAGIFAFLGCTAVGRIALAQQPAAAEAPASGQSTTHWDGVIPGRIFGS